eukprot:snap_masked-scaffold_4-processed-gene-12.19-mRNA-1 protein AED:1.00 eAED:1.00 QI:0/0/0/0/1/1/3/0/179
MLETKPNNKLFYIFTRNNKPKICKVFSREFNSSTSTSFTKTKKRNKFDARGYRLLKNRKFTSKTVFSTFPRFLKNIAKVKKGGLVPVAVNNLPLQQKKKDSLRAKDDRKEDDDLIEIAELDEFEKLTGEDIVVREDRISISEVDYEDEKEELDHEELQRTSERMNFDFLEEMLKIKYSN